MSVERGLLQQMYVMLQVIQTEKGYYKTARKYEFFSQIAVDALDKSNDGGGLVFLPEVFDDCWPFGVLSSISVLSRLEKLPEYPLYRDSLLSVFSFSSVRKTQLYFVIAQQLTKQIYQRALEAATTANNKLIHPRIVTSFANMPLTTRSQMY